MWFYQPLSQIEPLFVVATFVVATAALLPIACQIFLVDISPLSATSRHALSMLILGDIPIAISGVVFAAFYGWVPGMGWLSIVSFVLVSAALLILLVVYILIVLEFSLPKARDRLFLPQFVKAWAEDLEDLKKG